MSLKIMRLPLAVFIYLSLQLFSLSSFGWPMDSEGAVCKTKDLRDAEKDPRDVEPKNVFRNQQSDAIYLASGYFFKGLTYPLGMPQPFKNQPETNFLRQLADF